jgi:transcriptional regulator with GAF, ATPase, and Fis domain
MLELFRVIRAVADGAATILVRGETGTGKELVANAIHGVSPRASGPLVKINCASIPESLFESELYGAERGAFTGADKRRKGRFELAHGGTLFLDEVDEMPLSVQAKLLRSIQEKEIDRLGAGAPVRVDVRLIAATKSDLLARVREGRFREDLYYRLNVLPVTLPPLRERGEDIELLTNHFLRRQTAGADRPARQLSAAARVALRCHAWPGNVRELATSSLVPSRLPQRKIEVEHLAWASTLRIKARSHRSAAPCTRRRIVASTTLWHELAAEKRKPPSSLVSAERRCGKSSSAAVAVRNRGRRDRGPASGE